jgi:hypothetical protein
MSKKSAILILLFGTVSKMLNAQTAAAAEKLGRMVKCKCCYNSFMHNILFGIFFIFILESKIKKLEDELSR